MKKIIISFVVIVLIIGGIWWYMSSRKTNNIANNNTQNNYQAEKSSTNTNTNSVVPKTDNKENTTTNENQTTIPKTETEISSFSTKIYSKDPERQNNIGITCNTLTNTEIKPGETFSFCDTVGKATSAKGYQEADIYVDGKKEQGLGGGNCQVSTTLYNAVSKIPELEVVERHQHSGHVPYIQDGKDAAVAYGSYDFKFKNNTSNTIKIVMESTAENITAKIIKIS